jgi:hypothetical protein
MLMRAVLLLEGGLADTTALAGAVARPAILVPGSLDAGRPVETATVVTCRGHTTLCT